MPNDNEVKKEDKNISEKSIAMELLMEIRLQTKRWMIAFFTVVILWFATIVGFVWYLNQYDFSSYEVNSQDGGNANYIGNDGDINNGLRESEETNQEERGSQGNGN